MSKNSYRKLRAEAKKFYFSIGAVPCPAFGNELVYFDNRGWRHLIIKGRGYRDIHDQIRRFRMLTFVSSIVREATVAYSSTTTFFYIYGYGNNRRYKIVIRKINNGKLHFLSVMD